MSAFATFPVSERSGHFHAVVRLREELHAAQLWVDSILPPGARVRHTLAGLRAFSLECDAAALEALSSRPEVTHVLADLEVHALLERSMEESRVPPLWEEGLTGKGIRLAILDTGIDRGHPDFEGRLAALEDFTGCGVRDDVGHGTHTASVAAGSGEASRGKYRGAAPAAALLIGRVLDRAGSGRMSDVMAGLLWALTREARVLNLSLGTREAGHPDDALAWAVEEIAARGVMVVAAAGETAGGLPSPAASRGAMAVESYEVQGIESVEPEAGGVATRLAAPGQGIVAARAFGTPAESPVGEQYAAASGSSAAAANVSGVCTLLLEAVPEATPAQVSASLLRAGRTLAEGRAALNALAALADLRERIRRPESSTRAS